jgi:hypothetical protein
MDQRGIVIPQMGAIIVQQIAKVPDRFDHDGSSSRFIFQEHSENGARE